MTTVGKISLSSLILFDFVLLVGKPIHVTRVVEPSETEIDQLHQQYLLAVEQLYNSNKANYGFEHVQLEIV